MKKRIDVFCEKIRNAPCDNTLISEQSFKIDSEHTGYLYAYKSEKHLHIDAGVSVGDVCFENIENIYYHHVLHEHLCYRNLDLKSFNERVENLMKKVIVQLDILRPHYINAVKNKLDKVL